MTKIHQRKRRIKRKRKRRKMMMSLVILVKMDLVILLPLRQRMMGLENLMTLLLTLLLRKPLLPPLQQMISVALEILETLGPPQLSSPQKLTTVLAILEASAIPRQLRWLLLICLARLAQGRRSLLTLPLRRAVLIFSTSPPSPPLMWADSLRTLETWESITTLNPLAIFSIRNLQIWAHPTCLIPPPPSKRKRTLRNQQFLRNPKRPTHGT